MTTPPQPPASLTLLSSSRATDAAHVAAKDIADVAVTLGADYRLVGGIAVTLLTYVHRTEDVFPRETADADLGAALEVVADPRLAAELLRLGYERDGGNRLTRSAGAGPTSVASTIDVLVPSTGPRLESNLAAGDLTVDGVPGLTLALRMAPSPADVDVTLSTGEHLRYVVLLPHVLAALALKAAALEGRAATRDAVDIWRLAATAHAAGVSAENWPRGASATDAQGRLDHLFATPRSPGPNALRMADPPITSARRAEALLLVRRLLPASTRSGPRA